MTEPRLTLTSTAFSNGAPIPRQYTADGRDVSPPLAWDHVPEGTQAFALICDDPDAPVGTWVHWVLYGWPGDAEGLPEAVPPDERLGNGAVQGTNDFGNIGYGGPAPPPGKPHRYYFRLYAIDAAPSLAPGATKRDVLRAIEGHVLGQTELMGTYSR